MAKRIGVFVDISNLYYCVRNGFHGRHLDYKKYYDFIKPMGEVQVAIAYGAQMEQEASSFIHCLREIGYTPKYKVPKSYGNDQKLKRKADWDVGIAVDMINMVLAGRIDMVVLGCADGDLAPAVEWVMSRSVDVIILGSGISRDLKDAATKWIEIPESLLEDKKSAPKGGAAAAAHGESSIVAPTTTPSAGETPAAPTKEG